MALPRPDASDPVLSAEAGWYLFHRHDCHGPFTRNQVVALISKKRIDASWMIMREGWSEWRSLVDCLDELAAQPKADPSAAKVGAPRAKIRAAIVAENKHARAYGQARDISVSGIFVALKDMPFRLGEQLTVHVHAVELKEAFDVKCEVVRVGAGAGGRDQGYGLRFLDLGNDVVVDIARLIGYRPAQAFGEMVNSFPFNRPGKAKRR